MDVDSETENKQEAAMTQTTQTWTEPSIGDKVDAGIYGTGILLDKGDEDGYGARVQREDGSVIVRDLRDLEAYRKPELSPATIQAAIDESVREDRTVELEVANLDDALVDIDATVNEETDCHYDMADGQHILDVWSIDGPAWKLRLVLISR